MTEESQFEDAEAYQYNFDRNKLTFKDIILMHLKKIGEFASVEFTGGYWEKRSKMIGGAVVENKYYVPDTREVYSNAVEYLADMLSPYFDTNISKAEGEANKAIQKAWKDSTSEEHFQSTKDKISYRAERRAINRKLFRALCCFLYRKKYLELGSIED